MQVDLEVISGHYAGKTFRLPGHGTFLFGSSPSAHLRFPETRLRPLHSLIEVTEADCRVVPLDSREKPSLNGRVVASRHRLDSGNRLTFANEALIVRLTQVDFHRERTARRHSDPRSGRRRVFCWLLPLRQGSD